MTHLITARQVLSHTGACKLNSNKHPLVMFKVKVMLTNRSITMFCIGANDVYEFIESKKLEYGLENYNGYCTEAIPLSSYSASIIKKGVETLKV